MPRMSAIFAIGLFVFILFALAASAQPMPDTPDDVDVGAKHSVNASPYVMSTIVDYRFKGGKLE